MCACIFVSLWIYLFPGLLYSSGIEVSCLSTVQFLSSGLLGSNLSVRSEAATAAERMSVHVVALGFARTLESPRESRERERERERERKKERMRERERERESDCSAFVQSED